MKELWKSFGVLERTITELCESKTKQSDVTVVTRDCSLPQICLLQKHCLATPHECSYDFTELLQGDLELATIMVMQFHPREEWELLLRNRLEKMKRADLLALIPDRIDSHGSSPKKSDDLEGNMKLQVQLGKDLESDDPNLHLYALQTLLKRVQDDVVADICRRHLGRLLIESEDPEVLTLALTLIISLGVNGKNARAVITKLEALCDAWPLKGRPLVELILKSVGDADGWKEIGEDLYQRVLELRVERVLDDKVAEVEDMLPFYFFPSNQSSIEELESNQNSIEEQVMFCI